MKLVIDIPDYDIKRIKEYYEGHDPIESTYDYIYHGQPLSEVLDKISAEIREDYDPTTEGRFADDTYDAFEQGKKYCLDIIEKYKGENE